MREYTAFEAQSMGGTSVLGRIQRAFSNWRKRRKLRELLDLDDYMLSDIGLTRLEVISAMHFAWSIDPVRELERVSRKSTRRGLRSR